jgi:hypothetical protein
VEEVPAGDGDTAASTPFDAVELIARLAGAGGPST